MPASENKSGFVETVVAVVVVGGNSAAVGAVDIRA